MDEDPGKGSRPRVAAEDLCDRVDSVVARPGDLGRSEVLFSSSIQRLSHECMKTSGLAAYANLCFSFLFHDDHIELL